MEYPVGRNEVRFRGREFEATEADMAAFLTELMAAFPEARLMPDLNWEVPDYQEISIEEAAKLYGANRNFMIIFDPKWKAKIAPYEHKPDKFNVLNVPHPMVRFRGGYIQNVDVSEIGRTIRVCREGVLDGQSVAASKEQSRIIDKVLRIHRKHVTNYAVAYDLKTGKVVGEEKSIFWFCPEMARRSLEEEDLYLQIKLSQAQGKFLGYKARPS